MKIGIITFHNAHNYGAMLQVYALQETIKDFNKDVKVINYENKKIISNYKVFKPLRKNLIKYSINLISDILNYKKNVMRYKKFDMFMNKKLNLTESIKDINVMNNNIKDFDICITGSDQVWNSDIVGELSDIYTLNFGNENLKRVSYAASIGDISLIKKHKEDYQQKISKLDNISVRENDAKEALSKIIDKQIETVLDPTLLLTKEEWNSRTKQVNMENEKYILAYVVEADEEYLKIVNYLSKITGLKIIHFEKIDKSYTNILKSAYTDGPSEFVNLIKNAEYVVATSFHATVFSIIFNKRFFIVPHRKTGSRVTSLLDKLEISDRAIYSLEEFNNKDYNKEINYKKVEEILDIERQKSIEWLKNAIEN